MKSRIILAIGLAVLLAASAFAGHFVSNKSHQAWLTLYQSPSTQAHIVAQYYHPEPLTTFYRKGNWLKVGNSHDGTVGWVSLSEMQNASDRPSSHSQPVTTIEHTPYGPVKTSTQEGTLNGMHYRISSSQLQTQDMTPAQKRAWMQNIRMQQMAIDEQIQQNIQQMNQVFQNMQPLMLPFTQSDNMQQ